MSDENPDPENPPESEPGPKSLRLKTLAEQKYIAGNLKSALKYAKRAHRLDPSLEGIDELLAAFEILGAAVIPISPTPTDDASSATPSPPDYYKILQTERFAHLNTIKKQYKKLALALHPDKNPYVACEEAFKYVGEGFRVLSDRIRRKEYDLKLRLAMQNEAEAAAAGGVGVEVEEMNTFWTACSTCRLLHKFERKYLGHILVCPSCKKSFEAVEVVEENAGMASVEEGKEEAEVNVRTSERIKAKRIGKMSSVGEILERSRDKNVELEGKKVEKVLENFGKKRGLETRTNGYSGVIDGKQMMKNLTKKRGVRPIKVLSSKEGRNEERIGGVEDVRGTRTVAKRSKVVEEEMMTLAEMQLLVKKKVSDAKLKEKENKEREEMEKEKEQDEEGQLNENDVENENMEEKEEENETEEEKEEENESEKEMEVEMEKEEEPEKDREKGNQKINKKKRKMRVRKVLERDKGERARVSNDESMAILIRKASKRNGELSMQNGKRSRQNKLRVLTKHDSDFYEFDKDREERSFRKGQIWAVYDNEDGIPRHYGLIEDVCVDPFEVRMSWLEYQSSGDHQLDSLEEMGFDASCGRFKVSEKATVKSVKMFSHLADFERAAREVYRIYPKKGSVWAIYNENAFDSERSDQTMPDKNCYDIVVFLTSYSDIHASSVAYLDKVDGKKTIFKRREIGLHGIRFLEKDEFKLLSHQIPGRKLSEEEVPGLPKNCWELDPASLPTSVLTVGWRDTNPL